MNKNYEKENFCRVNSDGAIECWIICPLTPFGAGERCSVSLAFSRLVTDLYDTSGTVKKAISWFEYLNPV